MTRREAIKILRPDDLSEDYTGGVYGCPSGDYYRIDGFHFDMKENEACPGDCTRCWDEKLSVEECASLISAVGEDVICSLIHDYLRYKKK